jgi:hypothetical protein
MPSIGLFLGASATSEFIVPCLENSVYDVEERVSLATIVSMTSLVQLRLVTPTLALDFVEKVIPTFTDVSCLIVYQDDICVESRTTFASSLPCTLGNS